MRFLAGHLALLLDDFAPSEMRNWMLGKHEIVGGRIAFRDLDDYS